MNFEHAVRRDGGFHWKLAKSTGYTKPAILIASNIVPLPNISGGSQYLCQTVLPMHEYYDLHLLLVGDKNIGNTIEYNLDIYKKYFTSVTLIKREGISRNFIKKMIYYAKRILLELPFLDINFYTYNAVRAAGHLIREYDIRLIDCQSTHMGYFKLFFPNVPALLTSHNIECELHPFWPQETKGWKKKLEAYVAKRSRACARHAEIENRWGFEAMTFVSREDLNKVTGCTTKYYAPPCFAIKERRKPSDNIFRIVWIGGFWWGPNEEGMRWFAKHIFPLIQNRLEELNIRIDIIGGNPTAPIKAMHDGKRVFVHGLVDDIEPFMEKASLSIAPILTGGGVRIKIIESLSWGIPVLSTSKGCEGIGLVPDSDICVEDNAEKFAARLMQLAGNPTFCEKLSQNGKEFLLRNFNLDNAIRLKKNIYDDLSNRPRRKTSRFSLLWHLRKQLSRRIRKNLHKNKFKEKTFSSSQPQTKTIERLLWLSPYTGLTFFKPIECLVENKIYNGDKNGHRVSVIIPIRNEIDTLSKFFQQLEVQTLKVDDILIVDHDSTDGTCEFLLQEEARGVLPIRILHAKDSPLMKKEKRSTVAGNRNYAAQHASGDILIFTDAGNDLDPDFFANLAGPLLEDPTLDFGGGIFDAQTPELNKHLVYDWDNMNWDTFIPGGRGIAVRKKLFEAEGGFPEFLTYASEDVYFDMACRRLSSRWAFNKKAVSHWHAPTGPRSLWEKFYAYGIGDGESGIGDQKFYSAMRYLKYTGIISSDIINLDFMHAAFFGYLCGRKNRDIMDARRGIKKLLLLCCESPLHQVDSTVELIRNYVNKNYRVIGLIADETTVPDDKKPKYIDIDFSRFELQFIDDFRIEDFITCYGRKDLRYAMEVQIDPQNSGPRSEKFAKQLRRQLLVS